MLSLYSNDIRLSTMIEITTREYIKSLEEYQRILCLNLSMYNFCIDYTNSDIQKEYYINSIDWEYEISTDRLTPKNIYCDFEIFNKDVNIELSYDNCNVVINTINYYRRKNSYIIKEKGMTLFIDVDLSSIKHNNNVYIENVTSELLWKLKELNINLRCEKDLYLYYNTLFDYSKEDSIDKACEFFDYIINLNKFIRCHRNMKVKICINENNENSFISLLKGLEKSNMYYKDKQLNLIIGCDVDIDTLVLELQKLNLNF